MRSARIAAFVSSAMLIAGCGGGSTTPAAPAAPASISKIAKAPSGPVYATATLKLRFPSTFHVAKIAKTSTSASKRSAQYVNPGANVLDVFVVDTTQNTVSQPVSNASIVNAGDGTQTETIPLFSADTQYIVAVESETGVGSTVLSIGETDLPANTFSLGSTAQIGLTMQMNVSYVGLMTGTADSLDDAEAFPIGTTGNIWNFSGSSGACAPFTETFSAFATDPTGGFATGNFSASSQTGVGGIATPTLASYVLNQATGLTLSNASQQTGATQDTGYSLNFSQNGGTYGVTMNFSVTNPAAAILNDVYDNGGSVYPGAYYLYYSDSQSLGLNSINPNPGTTQISTSGFCGG